MSHAILVTAHVASRYGADLCTIAPDRDLMVLRRDPLTDEQLASVEIAFFSYDTFPELAPAFMGASTRCPNLRWLHSLSAGVDHPVFRGLIERGVEVTTSSGSSAKPIAHTVMLYVLAHARHLLAYRASQQRHEWERRDNRDLEGATMLVVGMGPIGAEVARLGQAFGMEVSGLRRTPSPDDPCPTATLDTLADAVTTADYVVSALPLAPETHEIFSAHIIAAMKPGAYFVNVGRGPLVDEPALLEAVRSGHLGGAGLDVFVEEPLPANSPWWDAPNTIITPHNSAAVPSIAGKVADIFLDNLRRHVAGAPKRNVAT